MNDEGVLVSSSIDSAGRAGKVLLGIVSVGTAVAGGLLGAPGAFGALAGQFRVRGTTQLPETPTEDQDPVIAAYAIAFPDVYFARAAVAELVQELAQRTTSAARDLAETDEGPEATDALHVLRARERALAFARSEAARLDAHFDAWRATTVSTRMATYELVIDLDEIRVAAVEIGADGRPQFPNSDPTIASSVARMKKIWGDLGVLVLVDGPRGKPQQLAEPIDNTLLVRVPRRVTLSLYTRAETDRGGPTPTDAAAVLIDSRPYLVMDELCEIQAIRLRKSLWAKRTSSLAFSNIGALSGLATTQTAAAAALAETAQAIPGTIATSLEQSTRTYTDVAAARSRAIDERLVELNRLVALKQQEIALAGMYATAGQAADLARLKQDVEILQQRKALADTAD